MQDALLAGPTARLNALLPDPLRWFDLTGAASRDGWAARGELGARLTPTVAGFAAVQAGSRWADPTIDVRGEVGLRVSF